MSTKANQLTKGRIEKRHFLSALKCPTRGWYAFHAPREKPTPGIEWRWYVGTKIGQVAQEKLGKGVVLPRGGAKDRAPKATAQFLASPSSDLAFEATFATDLFIARADAIHKNGNAWDLIEVKSGVWKEPKLGKPGPVEQKKDYIQDLAFTTFVAELSGLRVARRILILVNGGYSYGGPRGDLLVECDVTEKVRELAQELSEKAPQIASAIMGETPPPATLLLACKNCDFYKTDCLGVNGPEYPLFLLPSLNPRRKGSSKLSKFETLTQSGIEDIMALPPAEELTSRAMLSAQQVHVAEVIRSGRPYVEEKKLKQWLDLLKWPVSFLDFEGLYAVIPWLWFPCTTPYGSQMPFQFSLHILDDLGAKLSHHEYLARLGKRDWRKELTSNLANKIPKKGSILAFNKSYEKGILEYLSALPSNVIPSNLAKRVKALIPRLCDLQAVFKASPADQLSGAYYHPGFRGSHSLKAILPILVPGIKHTDLQISDGVDAFGSFALMWVGKISNPAEIKKKRRDLLEYCKLDTLALACLHEKLTEISTGQCIE